MPRAAQQDAMPQTITAGCSTPCTTAGCNASCTTVGCSTSCTTAGCNALCTTAGCNAPNHNSRMQRPMQRPKAAVQRDFPCSPPHLCRCSALRLAVFSTQMYLVGTLQPSRGQCASRKKSCLQRSTAHTHTHTHIHAHTYMHTHTCTHITPRSSQPPRPPTHHWVLVMLWSTTVPGGAAECCSEETV